MLIEAGADPTAVTNSQSTVLHQLFKWNLFPTRASSGEDVTDSSSANGPEVILLLLPNPWN